MYNYNISLIQPYLLSLVKWIKAVNAERKLALKVFGLSSQLKLSDYSEDEQKLKFSEELFHLESLT